VPLAAQQRDRCFGRHRRFPHALHRAGTRRAGGAHAYPVGSAVLGSVAREVQQASPPPVQGACAREPACDKVALNAKVRDVGVRTLLYSSQGEAEIVGRRIARAEKLEFVLHDTGGVVRERVSYGGETSTYRRLNFDPEKQLAIEAPGVRA
jgi:hypothetical protein